MIGEAIQADFEARLQDEFLPVDVPSEVPDQCEANWDQIADNGLTVCVPEGWKQTDRAGPDYLVIESPDGSADVLVSLKDQPGIGVHGCNNAVTVTAGPAVAVVCSIAAEDFEPPVATLYGFTLNSGLYVQIRSEFGSENPHFADALTIAMNVAGNEQ